ncbi:hypothetical protein [Flavobacterium sp.]|uniref:hypothetical protein n=1 Tax=Flavobacterium sp. TaxID=239 RepID=UPI00261933CD|nr:hypothetical protein [Flavobacterium sp.]
MIEDVNKILEFIVQNKLILIDWNFSIGGGELAMHIKKDEHIVFIRMEEDEDNSITKENFERKFNCFLADKV